MRKHLNIMLTSSYVNQYELKVHFRNFLEPYYLDYKVYFDYDIAFDYSIMNINGIIQYEGNIEDIICNIKYYFNQNFINVMIDI